MKQLLLTLLFLSGMQFFAWAQNPITMTSTAEECISFIEKMANTKPPDADETFRFKFDGTTFNDIVESTTGSGSVFKTLYIDWMQFRDFKIDDSKDELIKVSFRFDATLPHYFESWDKERIWLRKRFDRNGFGFSVPVSNQNKISELKIAANRLAQLAKSKSSTLLQVTIPPDALKPLPDESETKDFILAKMSAYKRSTFNEDFRLDYDGFKVNTLFYTHNGQPIEEILLQYKDLKGINVVGNDIIFTGKTTIENLRTYKSVTSSDLIYNLKVDMPPSEKDKLLKALKHYVWMKGVDLVKDDLFGE